MEYNQKDYIQSLENLLIFMCDTYSEIDKTVLEDAAKKKSDFIMRFPKIQGSSISFSIKDIGKLKREQTKISIKKIFRIMNFKRKLEVVASFLKIRRKNISVISNKMFEDNINNEKYLVLDEGEKWQEGTKKLKDIILNEEYYFDIDILEQVTDIKKEKWLEISNEITEKSIINSKKVLDLINKESRLVYVIEEILKKEGFGFLSNVNTKGYSLDNYYIYQINDANTF
jgi:hypothetical protein